MRESTKAIVVLIGVTLLSTIEVQAGGLYREGNYQALVSDRKAHQVGDLLTVVVYENSSATSTANTSSGRNAGVGFDIESPGKIRFGGIKFNNDLDGRGRTQREGRVLAQITVSVRDVADNGDLLVAGQQFLEVNNERQQIRVEGRVRPYDISNINTVQSTRIADAKISYLGDGDIADKQHAGWWQRVLTWFGL